MNSQKAIIIGVAIGLSVLVWTVAIVMVRQVGREPVPAASSPAPSLPAEARVSPRPSESPATQAREFTNRSPRELLSLYQGRAGLQADALMEPFKGMWIEAEGQITLLLPDAGGSVAMLRNQGDAIECRFGQQWVRSLGRFNLNDSLGVRGKIAPFQNGQQLYLQECEVVSPGPAKRDERTGELTEPFSNLMKHAAATKAPFATKYPKLADSILQAKAHPFYAQTALTGRTSEEIRTRVANLTQELRALEADHAANMKRLLNIDSTDDEHRRQIERLNEEETESFRAGLLQRARDINDEACTRLGIEHPANLNDGFTALNSGLLYGKSPLSDLADYLEWLGEQLP